MNGIGISRRAGLALAGLGLASGAAALGAGPAAAQTPGSARAPRTVTVRLEQTGAGRILTDGSGFTLYMFTRDRRNRDTCRRVPGCLAAWPALTTTRRPVPGPHVQASLMGMITLHGNVNQVTYAGHPLYRYALDFKRRAVLYVGAYEFGGLWDGVTSTGRPRS